MKDILQNSMKIFLSQNEIFENSFCCPLLSYICQKHQGSEVLKIIEDIWTLPSCDVLKYLNITHERYLEIMGEFLLNCKIFAVRKCNIVSLYPLDCLSILKEFEIQGRVFVRSCDLEIAKENDFGIFCDPFFDNDEKMNQISMTCGEFKLPIIVNLYDDLEKTGILFTRNNMSPMQYLEDLGILDRDCSILNLCNADKDDFALMSSYGVKAILTPYDSLSFGMGCVKFLSLLQSGVEIKIASPISNNLLREVDILTIVTRGDMKDPDLFLNMDLLKFIKVKLPIKVGQEKKKTEKQNNQKSNILKFRK